jgi:hypothetical protein
MSLKVTIVQQKVNNMLCSLLGCDYGGYVRGREMGDWPYEVLDNGTIGYNIVIREIWRRKSLKYIY